MLSLEPEVARLRELVDSVTAIFWEADPETIQFTFVSSEAERLLGYPLDQWTSEPDFWINHLHPDDRTWAPQFCMRAIQDRRDHRFDLRMIAADGSVVWLRDTVRVISDDGEIQKVVGVMFDVTDQKLAEQALIEEKRRADRHLSITQAMIVGLDEKGCVNEWSAGAETITGWSRDDVYGRDWFSNFIPSKHSQEFRLDIRA